jgi:5,10-methylene-tetrahydrofolate dehydrogenase/Methenyl tetrahydrofolate cyclohydrolase
MIISGKDIAAQLRANMQQQVDKMLAEYGRTPSLVVIQVGDDPASTIYVRNKMRAAEYCHIRSRQLLLPNSITEQELCAEIARLNDDDDVDGILVQLPLPAHINEEKIIPAIRAEKDVDGFHPDNAAALWLHQPLAKTHVPSIYDPVPDYGCTIACTPKGILSMLAFTGVELDGKRAVVVGRSPIVGKPMAKLLMDRQCTVTVAHSHTRDLPAVCREADILIAAVGKPKLITADCIKPGAIVIDVGISRLPDGTLSGDVDFEACKDIASYISPVPGGVGPMTVTMLMQNTIDCFRRRQQNANKN